MKKFTLKNIEHFFQQTNKIAPIYNDEKVHQLIKTPTAKARLKGKNNKPFKFIIMTSILAIIISTVLFWPNSIEKIPESIIESSKVEIAKTGINKEINKNQGNNSVALPKKKSALAELYNKNSENITTTIDSNKYSNWEINNKVKNQTPVSGEDKTVSFKKPIKSNKEKQYLYPETQILDSTTFIELNKRELINFGFKINKNRVDYSFSFNGADISIITKDSGTTMMFSMLDSKDTIYFEALRVDFTIDSIRKESPNNGAAPMLVTHSDGSKVLKFIIPKDLHQELFSQKFKKDYKTLLPLIIKKNVFGEFPKEDMVYWFLPSDEFFNKLPKHISNEILLEYNYVTATNKEELPKPDCKYFEECKNTLAVNNFKVFPNPATNNATVTFTLPKTTSAKISLVNLSGRERKILQAQIQFSAGDHRFDLDLSDVSEGIYLITLYSSNGIQTKRLIISK